MKKDVVIKVDNLSKKYQIGKQEAYLTLRDQLVNLPKKLFKKNKKEEFWALKDINFEVKRGEVIGIIGRNGAGKSTLLKILSRIVEPTTGKITMKGKVASLLEVGTGFNPELTGRENVYLNGAILGMSKQEIENKFSEIVKFSGVEQFLDTPVKRYSSGMYVRLAFAVAAHLDSDILLIDEVLAVGDTEFQKKCLGKMNDLSKSGKTVIFVSHNLETIRKICKNGIYLKDGKLEKIGKINNVLNEYRNFFDESSIYLNKKNDSKNKDIEIKKIQIHNNLPEGFSTRKNIKITVNFVVNVYSEAILYFFVKDFSENLYIFSSEIDNLKLKNQKIKKYEKGKYIANITIPADTFVPGAYSFVFKIDNPFIKKFDETKEIIVNFNNIITNDNKFWKNKIIVKKNVISIFNIKKL